MLKGVEVARLPTAWASSGRGFVSIETVLEGVFVSGLSTSPAKTVHDWVILCRLATKCLIDTIILAQMSEVFNVLSSLYTLS